MENNVVSDYFKPKTKRKFTYSLVRELLLTEPSQLLQMRISLPRRDLLGEKRLANLSEDKDLKPISQWAFIRFNLPRNTGCKVHQLLSGSNDQGIDNTGRTIRVSESGSDSQRAIKLWETHPFYAWTLNI